MKTRQPSYKLKNENSTQHKCWNCHEYEHYVRECPKRESTKPISKSKKRTLKLQILITQKDVIID